MKILIDAHVFDEPHQGTRTYLKGLYSEVIKLMPETFFYFAAVSIENLRIEFGAHPNVFFIKLRHGRLLRLTFEIPMIIKKYNIDYAHFQYIAPLIKYCRYIVTIHDVLFNDFKDSFPLSYRLIKNFLFRISAEKSDIFLTVSNYSKERISKYYQIPLDKIRVIPNGVGEDFFNMPIESSGNDIFFSHNLEKFILYVSRVEPRKNHLILLKAFNELQLWDRGYKLVFIGRQDLPYPELDSFLEEGSKELIESVFRISNVSHESLKLFYHHCALFVYPSIAEGFGIPPLEAITAGAPTLCSNSTAMSEFSFLEDDLFVPTDLEELKQKILRKISTADSIQRVLFLKDIVRKKYSWESSARLLVTCIETE